MLSIIVCSIKEENFQAFSSSVKASVGTEYEIIHIDNSNNKYSICQAYNVGASLAKFPFLCFIHEDVIFHTPNWGVNLVSHLENNNIGLVGVAGSSYKSFIPSSWSGTDYSYINIIQNYKFQNKQTEHIKIGRDEETPARAVVLDGVFLGTRRDVWEKYKFDEKLLTGFHGYDIDFSLQVSQEYSVLVVFDILLEHFSEGKPDDKWLHNAILISKKWAHRLPLSLNQHSFEEDQKIFYKIFTLFIWSMKKVELSFLSRIKLANTFFKMKYWDAKMAIKMIRYII